MRIYLSEPARDLIWRLLRQRAGESIDGSPEQEFCYGLMRRIEAHGSFENPWTETNRQLYPTPPPPPTRDQVQLAEAEHAISVQQALQAAHTPLAKAAGVEHLVVGALGGEL